MNRWKLAVAICCVAGSAAAADQGWYMGGAVGQVTSHYGSQDLANLSYSPGAHIDNDDVGGKVFGGYMYNPNFGVEGAYVNLGRAKFSGPAGGTPAQDKFSAEGVSLAALGKLWLNQDFA